MCGFVFTKHQVLNVLKELGVPPVHNHKAAGAQMHARHAACAAATGPPPALPPSSYDRTTGERGDDREHETQWSLSIFLSITAVQINYNA